MKKLKEVFAKLVNLFSKKVKTEEIVEIVKEVVAEEAPKKAKKKYYHHKPKTK